MATEQGYKYYSKEEIDEKLLDDFIYSTTEKACGKWIDGETIYKKTIVYTGSLSTGSNNIPHGITNLGKVVNKEIFAYRSSDGATLPLPMFSSSNQMGNWTISTTNVTLNTTFAITGVTTYITLYYTKSS